MFGGDGFWLLLRLVFVFYVARCTVLMGMFLHSGNGTCKDPFATRVRTPVGVCGNVCLTDSSCVAFRFTSRTAGICHLFRVAFQPNETADGDSCYVKEGVYEWLTIGPNVNQYTQLSTQNDITETPTTTNFPFWAENLTYQYADLDAGVLQCEDGFVLSGLGYCTALADVCSGICIKLHDDLDASHNNISEYFVIKCQAATVLFSFTTYSTLGITGYKKGCAILQNGWMLNESSLVQVAEAASSPSLSGINGELLNEADIWFQCPVDGRWGITNVEKEGKFTYKIYSIECAPLIKEQD